MTKSHYSLDLGSTSDSSTSVPDTNGSYDGADSVFVWDTHIDPQHDRFTFDCITDDIEDKSKEPLPKLWDPKSHFFGEDFLQQLSPCSLRVMKLKLEYSAPSDLVNNGALQDICLKTSLDKLDDEASSVQCTPTHSRCKKLQERRGSAHSLSLALKAVDLDDNLIEPAKEKSPEQFLLTAKKPLNRDKLKEVLSNIPRLHEEFWSIPNNHPDQLEVAGSALKNRYKFVIPNAHSRVKLPNVEAVDPLAEYINANYVKGYSGQSRAYIATQGPMTHTIQDFWTMVLSEKAPIIVQITRLEESQQVKCEQYIPPLGRVSEHGDVKVCVEEEEARVGYIVRKLRVMNDNIDHQVLHFWYTEWPDHKIPDNPSSLVNLAVEVENTRSGGTYFGRIVDDLKDRILRSGEGHWKCMTSRESVKLGVKSFSFDDARVKPEMPSVFSALYSVPRSAPPDSKFTHCTSSGPVVVHCSAGVGRTGCFLALCLGVQQLVAEGSVDVLAIVCALRHDRGGMVQTAEQYEFIHRGLHLFGVAYDSLTPDRYGVDSLSTSLSNTSGAREQLRKAKRVLAKSQEHTADNPAELSRPPESPYK